MTSQESAVMIVQIKKKNSFIDFRLIVNDSDNTKS